MYWMDMTLIIAHSGALDPGDLETLGMHRTSLHFKALHETEHHLVAALGVNKENIDHKTVKRYFLIQQLFFSDYNILRQMPWHCFPPKMHFRGE